MKARHAEARWAGLPRGPLSWDAFAAWLRILRSPRHSTPDFCSAVEVWAKKIPKPYCKRLGDFPVYPQDLDVIFLFPEEDNVVNQAGLLTLPLMAAFPFRNVNSDILAVRFLYRTRITAAGPFPIHTGFPY